ncbi:uncharacterized protein PV09_08374 [Verruconis gallopava]|uniref:Ribosome biogenesis protein Alb1 n=1 Tax=Verruconis gallopava TaxID=253628 RepID=A0A0D1YGW5_9PEZI|nr:uncharacterized protein PV09_08374 [Verruconis gallopava]KIW00022.1 hypothetical protein PV09_08374 [Verruconis gallopava]
MSKTAKAKTRKPSIHSRAARRATSPSLVGNVDKSLKDVQPPKRTSHAHLFAGARDAGVAKRKKGKQRTRAQLERQRRGAERAEAVKGQLETKLEKSLGKLKTIRDRRKDWDVLNADSAAAVGRASRFAALDVDAGHAQAHGHEAGDTPPSDEAGTMTLDLPVRPNAQEDRAAAENPDVPDDDIVE